MNTEINDKLDLLILFAAKDSGNDDVEDFKSLDISEVKLSRDFYAKQKRTVNASRHKANVPGIRKVLIRIAVALMALMSLGFLTVMAVPDLREAVFEVVIEWYDNYVSVRFEKAEEDRTSTHEPDESHSVIVPPTKIEKVMKPTYIPEGAEEDVVANNKFIVVTDYYLEDDLVLSFTQTLYSNKEKLLDNNTGDFYNIDINSYSAVAFALERNGCAIIWTDGNYYYYAQSYLFDIEDIRKIALSVQ